MNRLNRLIVDILKSCKNSLNEERERFDILYHGTDRVSANNIIRYGIDMNKSNGGYFGYGFYTTADKDLAISNYAEFVDDDQEGVILEFRLDSNANILDLRDEGDWDIWVKYAKNIFDKNLYKRLIMDGIDGLYDNSFGGVVIYNPKVLKLIKVIEYK